MIIKSVKLLKVTFDNSYKNVFDFLEYDEIKNFDVFLTQQFENLTVLSDGVFSVNSTNHNLTLSLKGYYETILNYNYCILKTNEGNKFYFITNVQSQNDNEENASCLVSLDFDVWHNYLNLLQDTSKFDENFVVKCHQDRFKRDDNNQKLYRFYSGTKEEYEDNLSHNKFFSNIRGGRKQILWLCIMFDDQLYYHDHITPFKIRKFTGIIRNLSNTPVAYIPVRVYDKNLEVYYNDIYIEQYFNEVQTPNDFPINLDSNTDLFHQLQNTHILDAFLTYHVPFRADVNRIEGNARAYIKIQDVVSDEPDGITSGIAISKLYETDAADALPSFNFNCICSFRGTLDYINDNHTINCYGDSYYNYDSEEFEKITSLFNYHNKISESKFYTHPFNYKSIEVRGRNEIVENVNDFSTLGVIFDCADKLIPNMTINRFGEKNKSPCFIKTQSHCVTSKDNFAEFVRNSGQSAYTSLFTGMLNKTLNSAIGSINSAPVAKSGVSTGLNVALDAMNFNAKLKDIKNQQDVYNIPDFIAQNDLYYQDNIFEYNHELFIDEEINFVLFNFMRYGYTLNGRRSLRKNSRFRFDYCRTEGCKLPFIPNIKDRTAIEDIYNSGVTKWHIYKDINTGYYVSVNNFDFTLNNPEICISSIPEKLDTPQTPIIEGGVMYIEQVPFATQYLIIDSDTGEIYYRGQSTEITIGNLLPIEEREFKLVVQARADGFLPSDYSGIAIFNTSFTITYYVSGLIANEDNPPSCSSITQTTLRFTANTSKVFPKDLKVCGAIIHSWDYENGILILENATSNVNIYITALPLGNYGTATFNYMYDGYLAVFVAHVNRDNTFTFANPTSTTFSVEENKCYDTEGSLTITQNSARGSNWILKNNFNNHYGWSNIKLKDNTTNITAKDSWYYVFTSATAMTDASYIPYNPYMPNYEYLLTITANNIDGLETNPVTVSSKNTTIFKFVPEDGYKLPENIIVTGADIVSWNSVSGILTLRLPTKSVNIQITGVAI